MALDRDAYFTPLADCEKIIETALNDHPELKHLKWVEPSAGSGNFVKAARLNGINDVEAYDIHPLGDNIIQRDFLKEETDLTGCFVFGNPPYGRLHNLTLKFIDRAFEQGAEYVGFLLMGSFSSYLTSSRIKEKCEVISIRKYCVKFENENNNVIKECLASDHPSVFVVFKKSDCRIKDEIFNENYEVSVDKNDFDFSAGYRRFFSAEDSPELGGKNLRRSFYIKELENTKRRPTLRLYKNKNYDEKFVKYLSSFTMNGKPDTSTLNFYSTYPHILKDLKNS